jgi:putative hemolysin
LRTALLARELLKQRGRRATVRFGSPVPLTSVAQDGDPSALTGSIRRAVDQLARSPARSSDETTARLACEVDGLPAESMLVESGAFQVFVARADHIPTVLREIGRLREVSYRMVGEGTGREIDLDRFDAHYLHLFSWHREHRQVVGAYRIGQTDRITAIAGVDGLYTRTLFTYDDRLVAKLSPALELGRSFVRPEYQKNYNALLLLWKGIGQFVVRHPEYRVLFGPVTISARYSDRSQRLLMAFLQHNHLDRDLSDLVQAINPSTVSPAPEGAVPASVEDANRLIAAADGGAAGVPILLRQYLKLNARLLGFNIDPSFGDALDALMMVDLTAVEPAILHRYLGREETARFLQRHLATAPAHAA